MTEKVFCDRCGVEVPKNDLQKAAVWPASKSYGFNPDSPLIIGERLVVGVDLCVKCGQTVIKTIEKKEAGE